MLHSSVLVGGISLAILGMGVASSSDRAPELNGGPAVMRRLTQEQYRNSIQDILGDVTLAGRFEPDPRLEHLIAVGAGQTTVTATALEEYGRMAMGIGAQVVDPKRRDQLIPCRPASASAPDEACARQFLGKVGRLLFRRPLTASEITGSVKMAEAGALAVKDFYFGLQLALAGLLQAPPFLFVREVTQPDPERPGSLRIDAHAMATRLSLLLWNSTPDNELLEAAERGELQTREGLARQVDRMLTSPYLERGVRAFFTDLLGFDSFESLGKDTQLYPNYSREVGRQAQEQTLRTIVDHLLVRDGDYRDLFTTRRTFMTPMLASVYQVQFRGNPQQYKGQYSAAWEWAPYQIPQDMPQAGILTQVSFLALHSHPGKTSPTLRGKALREVLMCQKVPDPPANVDFSKFEASTGEATTLRARLMSHNENPVCAGCHKIMDPAGLALENFDTIGAFRRQENNQPIDASGVLNGVAFADAADLGRLLHDDPQVASCAVQRVYAYGVGRQPAEAEKVWLKDSLDRQFAAGGYRWLPLLRAIALNPGFYRVAAE